MYKNLTAVTWLQRKISNITVVSTIYKTLNQFTYLKLTRAVKRSLANVFSVLITPS